MGLGLGPAEVAKHRGDSYRAHPVRQYLFGEGRRRTIEIEQRVVVVGAADSNLALANVARAAAHSGHAAVVTLVVLAAVAAPLALHQHRALPQRAQRR